MSGPGKFVDQLARLRDVANDPTLRLNHRDSRGFELGEVRGGAVLEQHALEAAVVRLPHSRLHADLGGHSGEDQMRDATGLAPNSMETISARVLA